MFLFVRLRAPCHSERTPMAHIVSIAFTPRDVDSGWPTDRYARVPVGRATLRRATRHRGGRQGFRRGPSTQCDGGPEIAGRTGGRRAQGRPRRNGRTDRDCRVEAERSWKARTCSSAHRRHRGRRPTDRLHSVRVYPGHDEAERGRPAGRAGARGGWRRDCDWGRGDCHPEGVPIIRSESEVRKRKAAQEAG